MLVRSGKLSDIMLRYLIQRIEENPRSKKSLDSTVARNQAEGQEFESPRTRHFISFQ
jgi:hypothetical protein